MPSLNLRNPLRRDPSRPTLRERAAALRATAVHLIRPRPVAPIAADTDTVEDPHAALLPALRQAFAWTREAQPFRDEPSSSPQGRAHIAVLNYSWNLSDRIVDLPPPTTVAGLGALALALSVRAEEAIGAPLNDGLDHERYPDERRLAAAVRAMMSVAGVGPFPGWAGFEVGPESEARWGAMMERAGEGSLPAWALAGKTGPDAGAASAAAGEPATPQAVLAPAPGLNLSGCPTREIARLYTSLRGVYDHLSAASQRPCFWEGDGRTGFKPAGAILDREVERFGDMLSACADEVAARVHTTDDDRDEALLVRISHELLMNDRVHDPDLMRDLNEAWSA